ncbi:MAG: DUF3160 domain-containing protein [Bdellovibrionales bacterium]|nr:DUF3160 domain-containing protein [Bdellovibrionales bacterium]
MKKGVVSVLFLFGLYPILTLAADEANYIVTDDLLPIYEAIPDKTPEKLNPLAPDFHFHNNPVMNAAGDGIIFGNPISGKPVKDKPEWIQFSPPIKRAQYNQKFRIQDMICQFVPARGLTKEPAFEKSDQRFVILNDAGSVRLQPNEEAKKVLELKKGEVITSTGKYTKGGDHWYRFNFLSDTSNEEFEGPIPERIGWLNEKELRAIDPQMDEGKIELNEIPSLSRNLPEEGGGNPPEKQFSEQDKALFQKSGFYIQRLQPRVVAVDDLVDRYYQENENEPRGAIFVTSDLYLHALHLIIDRMMQKIEETKLSPLLKEVVEHLYTASSELYSNSKNPKVKEAAKRNMWFTAVAATLLKSNLQLNPEITADVKAEVERISAASQEIPSAEEPSKTHEYLPGYKEDYSQYKVRGHYTVSEKLSDYFRAQMHLGRKNFLLDNSSATLAAILLTHSVFQDPKISSKWSEFSSAIDFLVGKAESGTPIQFKKLMDSVYRSRWSEFYSAIDFLVRKIESATSIQFKKWIDSVFDPSTKIEDYADEQKLESFQKKAKEDLPAPNIVSSQTGTGKTAAERKNENAGFKLIGQRYTLDADLYQRLTAPAVGSDDMPKNLPSALEVMALLGSKKAFDLLPKNWFDEIPNYKSEYEKSKQFVAGLPAGMWSESMYSSWLNLLSAQFLPVGSQQFFANSEGWAAKILNTSLASYTELKHDTILYAEQSYAEQGGGGEGGPPAQYAPPIVKGYVEPNPEFFSRFGKLVNLTIDLLTKANVLVDEYKNKLITIGQLAKKAEEIATKEVKKATITNEDYDWILNMPYKFNASLLLPSDFDADYNKHQKELQMALVADLATDAFEGRVLMGAIGYPMVTYVLVKDYSGGTRISRGYVYSYYEWADTKRWNDDEWKAVVYASDPNSVQIPEQPKWYDLFLKK